MKKLKGISLVFFLFSVFIVSSQNTIKVKKEKVPEVITIVDKSAEFPGGTFELHKFVSKSIVFPEKYRNDSSFRRCTVYIKFIIEETGKAVDAVVLKGCPAFPDCETEALKMVTLMPLWSPALLNNKPVKYFYQLPVRFQQ